MKSKSFFPLKTLNPSIFLSVAIMGIMVSACSNSVSVPSGSIVSDGIAQVTTPSKAAETKSVFRADYGLIEVGGKGIKGFTIDLENSDRFRACQRSVEGQVDNSEEAVIECLMRSLETLKTRNTTPIINTPDAIPETILATKAMVQEMLQKPVNPERIFVVGSSSIAEAPHAAQLKEAIDKLLTELRLPNGMELIDHTREATHDFDGVLNLIPKSWHGNPHNRIQNRSKSVVLDIGSGSTKGAFQESTGSEINLATFSYRLGTVSYSNEVNGLLNGRSFKDTSTELRKSVLLKDIRELSMAKPGMVNRERVYLLGGISWALKSFMLPGDKRNFPRIYPGFIDTLYQRATAPNAEHRLCKDNPDIAKEPAIDEICGNGHIFNIENIIAGMDLLKTFSEVMKFQYKEVYFVRESLYAWPIGYLKARCQENGGCKTE